MPKSQKSDTIKATIFKSYVLNDKVQFNNKYIKTKNRKRKLEAQFFQLLRILYLVRKHVYIQELSKKQMIHDIFHMSLLAQNILKKRRIDKTVEIEEGNYKEYAIEAIFSGEIYAKESKSDYLPGLYYLVLQKGNSKKENTKEPALTV